jgi:flavin reductase (DIM6/NTAB) family NADH-FMN oxidoreductase RutF
MKISDELKKTVGKALGRIPSGVFILTAGLGEGATAMMASWVQQASFVPPVVSVGVAKDRPIEQIIEREKAFALSVLGEHDHALMKKYARGVGTGPAAFEGVKARQGDNGAMILEGALAYLECRLTNICEYGGDHKIIVGEVTAGKLLRDGPSFVHLRGSGFHY